ncbi:hypothetical protein AWRIB429_0248 [Oenococcus oeni AWRIB429]|uniref:Uncharacterized protein n=1 Tax=Oenococcus oeni AWRIB429 TaxID=655225 RepID=D3L7B8_OENOE|nr:hypothetical protein AWRIB429_0248 [Oenococcus oeni AWRIB429]KZD13446.1 hypothetical protein AC229_0575 [Oenococcus oeni]SYW01414.1 conserved hypothetical protein [Oenococcus oeni]
MRFFKKQLDFFKKIISLSYFFFTFLIHSLINCYCPSNTSIISN